MRVHTSPSAARPAGLPRPRPAGLRYCAARRPAPRSFSPGTRVDQLTELTSAPCLPRRTNASCVMLTNSLHVYRPLYLPPTHASDARNAKLTFIARTLFAGVHANRHANVSRTSAYTLHRDGHPRTHKATGIPVGTRHSTQTIRRRARTEVDVRRVALGE
ncbi:hypothetical protein O3G_MSEX000601 [Manduca sexta]|nr:hypothetical protein O3G_MSEX000601 [Manduca sexta]